MTTVSAHIQRLCDEFSIRVIDGRRYPDIGETRATETMNRIYKRFGEDHLRWVLRTLTETSNNKALLDETGLWAASDLIRAYADVIDADPEAWFGVWDMCPVGELQFSLHRIRGVIPQRYALGGLVHERLYRRFEADQRQGDLLDERRIA